MLRGSRTKGLDRAESMAHNARPYRQEFDADHLGPERGQQASLRAFCDGTNAD